MEQVTQVAWQAAGTIIAALVPVVVGYLARWLRSNLSASQLQIARVLAHQAVRVAEELGRVTGSTGEAKRNVALATITSLAEKTGLKLSEEKALGFIHAALPEMRAELEPLLLEPEEEPAPEPEAPAA